MDIMYQYYHLQAAAQAQKGKYMYLLLSQSIHSVIQLQL